MSTDNFQGSPEFRELPPAKVLHTEPCPAKGAFPNLSMYKSIGRSLIDKQTPVKISKEEFDENNKRRTEAFRICAGGILDACQETHEGVTETPVRYAKAMREMLSGYFENPTDHIKVFSNVHSSSMITVMGVDFNSFCEHHMLPFYGKAYIGYIPNQQGRMVLGVSKLVRILHCFTNRFQVQERIGEQFCEFIEYNLQTHGVICVLKAQHMCMTRRGVKSTGTMVTSAIRGAFIEPVVRQEFMSLIGIHKGE